MTTLRALLGRAVLTRDTAERVGAADGVVIDPDDRRVVAVQLGTRKSSRFVTWDDIGAIGDDAIMVDSASAVREPDTNLEHRLASGATSVLGKRLLDDDGDEVGTVDDVAFDDTTGVLQHLRVADAEIPSDRLLGIGAYAVVVHADARP
jgi:sporulation protein YlmC with PRC-barrel domain